MDARARRFAALARAARALALASAIGFAGASSGFAGAQFVAGFEDLPLMPGLDQAPGAVLVFDQAAGRIVESLATATTAGLDRQAVIDYYAAALPQLGWVAETNSKAAYIREGERLTLDIAAGVGGAGVQVRFLLAPR